MIKPRLGSVRSAISALRTATMTCSRKRFWFNSKSLSKSFLSPAATMPCRWKSIRKVECRGRLVDGHRKLLQVDLHVLRPVAFPGRTRFRLSCDRPAAWPRYSRPMPSRRRRECRGRPPRIPRRPPPRPARGPGSCPASILLAAAGARSAAASSGVDGVLAMAVSRFLQGLSILSCRLAVGAGKNPLVASGRPFIPCLTFGRGKCLHESWTKA